MDKLARANLWRGRLRELLAQRPDLNAAALSLRIGRDKGFIGDFLRGKKQSINAADWAAIERALAIHASEVDPQDVELLELALRRITKDERRTTDLLRSLLEELQKPR
ncbi:MAG: hypothetical protein ACO27F_02020 [Beijerinckiaceae bacterium]|jgi:hypothetical protein